MSSSTKSSSLKSSLSSQVQTAEDKKRKNERALQPTLSVPQKDLLPKPEQNKKQKTKNANDTTSSVASPLNSTLPSSPPPSSSSLPSLIPVKPDVADIIFVKNRDNQRKFNLAIFVVFRAIVSIRPEYESDLTDQATALMNPNSASGMETDEKSEYVQKILQAKPTLEHDIQSVVDQVLSRRGMTDAQSSILTRLRQAVDVSVSPMGMIDGVVAVCRWKNEPLTGNYSLLAVSLPQKEGTNASKFQATYSSDAAMALQQWYEYCHFLRRVQEVVEKEVRTHPIVQLTSLDLRTRIDVLFEWELISTLYDQFEKLRKSVCDFFLKK